MQASKVVLAFLMLAGCTASNSPYLAGTCLKSGWAGASSSKSGCDSIGGHWETSDRFAATAAPDLVGDAEEHDHGGRTGFFGLPWVSWNSQVAPATAEQRLGH